MADRVCINVGKGYALEPNQLTEYRGKKAGLPTAEPLRLAVLLSINQ